MEGENYASEVAGNVRAAISLRRISKAQARAAIGMTTAQFGSRYSGRIEWRLDELKGLEDAFDIPRAEFFVGSQRFPDPVTRVDDQVEQRGKALLARTDELQVLLRQLSGSLQRAQVELELIRRELDDA